jgi:hypothetical protein
MRDSVSKKREGEGRKDKGRKEERKEGRKKGRKN